MTQHWNPNPDEQCRACANHDKYGCVPPQQGPCKWREEQVKPTADELFWALLDHIREEFLKIRGKVTDEEYALFEDWRYRIAVAALDISAWGAAAVPVGPQEPEEGLGSLSGEDAARWLEVMDVKPGRLRLDCEKPPLCLTCPDEMCMGPTPSHECPSSEERDHYDALYKSNVEAEVSKYYSDRVTVLKRSFADGS